MKCFYTCLFVACFGMVSFSQKKMQVLFLGNSYTEYNNLPQLVASIALSKGDTLVFDSHTPGGQSFQQHSVSTVVRDKLRSRKWDYVVLQEQSQFPSLAPGQVQSRVLPYATALCQQIRNNDICPGIMFYMTWGKENGDALMCMSYPPVCTYGGMQQRLRESYLLMAGTNHAEVAPVGMVWKYVREHAPEIALYDADGSHPGLTGSYLAACTFYASLFHKSPVGAFVPDGIPPHQADSIQAAVALVVLDSMEVWNMDSSRVHADFIFTVDSVGNVDFINQSVSAVVSSWDFGDGTFSSQSSPQHIYSRPGAYTVILTVRNGCKTGTIFRQVIVMAGTNTFPEEEGMGRLDFPILFLPDRINLPAGHASYIYNHAQGTLSANEKIQESLYHKLHTGIYYISERKKICGKS